MMIPPMNYFTWEASPGTTSYLRERTPPDEKEHEKMTARYTSIIFVRFLARVVFILAWNGEGGRL